MAEIIRKSIYISNLIPIVGFLVCGLKHSQYLNPMNESPQLRPMSFIAETKFLLFYSKGYRRGPAKLMQFP